MGGAQPLAVTMNEGVALCVEVDEARIERRLRTHYLGRATAKLDEAVAGAQGAPGPNAPAWGCLGGDAAGGDPVTPRRGFSADSLTNPAVMEALPENEPLHRWLRLARQRVQFQGLPARICWLGYGEREKVGLRFNEMVKSGELAAPIVIGRDHLDAGSVASPYRETERMRDGSDAIADWPILNALVNTAAGASWVSVHHGGGVGIGNSIHAGMVVVADGTEAMADRLQRVLTTDPGMGVIRHADAGYETAIDFAREHGIDRAI